MIKLSVKQCIVCSKGFRVATHWALEIPPYLLTYLLTYVLTYLLACVVMQHAAVNMKCTPAFTCDTQHWNATNAVCLLTCMSHSVFTCMSHSMFTCMSSLLHSMFTCTVSQSYSLGSVNISYHHISLTLLLHTQFCRFLPPWICIVLLPRRCVL